MTALHHGVEHANCVGLLLEEDALVDAQDHEGRTPLWYAVSDGYRESAEILLAHSANPHLKDSTVPIPRFVSTTGLCMCLSV
jgi:ankyrin repeat protein